MKNARDVARVTIGVRRFALVIALVFFFVGDHRHSLHGDSIVLVPINDVPASTLAYFQRELPPLVHRNVVIGRPLHVPRSDRYLGGAILAALKREPYEDADRVLGVLDGEAYAPGLNFIYGQAKKPGRVALIALSRLKTNENALKVATHELGHSYGFSHCENRSCVMHFANTFRELEESGVGFCEERVPE